MLISPHVTVIKNKPNIRNTHTDTHYTGLKEIRVHCTRAIKKTQAYVRLQVSTKM